jgi:hypothetical protein
LLDDEGVPVELIADMLGTHDDDAPPPLPASGPAVHRDRDQHVQLS